MSASLPPRAPAPRSGLERLNDAFQALTYREMMQVAEALVESLDAVNGLKIKDKAMADAIDAFGEFLAIEVEIKAQ